MWKIITSLSRGFRQGWQPSGSALWQSPQAQQPLTSTGEGSLNPNTVASTTTCKGHDRHLARLGDDSHTHRESSGAKGNKQNSFQQDNWQSAFQLHQRLYGALRWGAAFVLCMQLWRPLHIHRPCDKEKKKPCIFKTLVAFTQPQGIRRAILPQNSRSTQKHNQNYSTADEPRGNSSVLQKTNTAGKKEGDDHFKAVKLKLAHGTNIVHNVIGLQLVQGSKFESAVKWFETASQDGYSKAQYNLGVCYEQGLGVKQDVKKAAEFYHQAAQRGHAMAQYNLGVLFLDEQFGRSEAEALELLKKAASGGVIQAQSYVGVQCLETHDYDTAFSLLKTATEHKDQEAPYYLGMCYENGWGTAADLQQAAELYSKAANDGHIAATHSLGYFYEHGLGGLMANKSFAEELYKMAADLGDISAQLDLERLQAFEAIASDKDMNHNTARLQHSASLPNFGCHSDNSSIPPIRVGSPSSYLDVLLPACGDHKSQTFHSTDADESRDVWQGRFGELSLSQVSYSTCSVDEARRTTRGINVPASVHICI